MSNNLKVNAKTKPLELKKKHNLLVEKVEDVEEEIPSSQTITNLAKQAIQADKDILSQIEYDEENDILIFPKNVLPLRIVTADDTKFYFDYNEDALVDTYNEVVTGLDYDTNNRVNILSWIENVDAGNIVSIQYILFDVVNDLELKTYYIYHPITSAGTKLYQHSCQLSTTSTMFIITNRLTSFANKNLGSVLDDLYDNGDIFSVRFMGTGSEMIYNYDTTSLISFNTNNAVNPIDVSQVTIVADDVDEL